LTETEFGVMDKLERFRLARQKLSDSNLTQTKIARNCLDLINQQTERISLSPQVRLG